ncbi:MAG: hypothetical protein BWY15_01225 [Firmicutes bacterium ADurb.Bin193]|nr:MAG: hypothetical protein BWY15_01225 [Firmicutes bacterium ADurb.Bin193]
MSKSKYIPAAAVFISAIILIYVLVMPIGVADGGGQYKFVESIGLAYVSPPSAEYIQTQYIASGANGRISDTPSAIATLAVNLGGGRTLNISLLGFLYAILLLFGIRFVVKGGARGDIFDIVIAALCVLIFADTGYTAFLNTLSGEAATFTTLLISVGLIALCYKKHSARAGITVMSALAAISFALCGTLQALVGIVLGLVIWGISYAWDTKGAKYTAIITGGIVVAVSIAFAVTYKPVDYNKNIYNSVFFGIAKYESVEALGLNPRLNELKEVFYSESLISEYNLKNEFFDKINYGKIVGFYITHPVAFFKGIDSSVKNAYALRPSYLGNFAQGRGEPGGQSKWFSLYSSFKAKFIPNTLTFTVIFFGLYFGFLIFIFATDQKKRPIAGMLAALGLAAGICLKIPFVLSGGFEIGRALFLYNILFDLMVISAIVGGARFMRERRQILQNKYGATQ